MVGLVFFFNLRFIARALGGIRIKRRVGDLVISEQLSETVVAWSVAVLSALVGAWFGASIPPSMGLGVLYLLNAPEWGVTDPFLGRDLTFFVILLPLLRQLVVFGLVVAFLVFTAAAGGYAATGALQWGPGPIRHREPTPGASGGHHRCFLRLAGRAVLAGSLRPSTQRNLRRTGHFRICRRRGTHARVQYPRLARSCGVRSCAVERIQESPTAFHRSIWRPAGGWAGRWTGLSVVHPAVSGRAQ